MAKAVLKDYTLSNPRSMPALCVGSSHDLDGDDAARRPLLGPIYGAVCPAAEFLT